MGAGGCVIAGAAGVGKSRLAAEAAGTGGEVLHVLATASAATVPFGALSHLLPARFGEAGAAIPEFLEHLRNAYGSTRPTLVVDDAHLLDGASAALVLALITTAAARVLVTIRSSEPVPDAVTALWKEHGLVRIELQSLSRPDVVALVSSLLGAPVHRQAVDRINDLSLGNPMYITELIRDASRTGALDQVDGRWRWSEELLETIAFAAAP